MKAAPFPQDEPARLRDLENYHILDTEPEEAFDGLARVAALVCETPMAFVNMLDGTRQWFKATVGLDLRETPREHAFCGYTILTPKRPLVVHDTLEDARFMDNPLVQGEPHIRFYAGVPLVTPDGYALGTLSVLDHVPRELRPEQLNALRDLARQAVAQLELRRKVNDLRDTIRVREEAEQQLDALHHELENITETVPDIIYQLDLGGRLVKWNKQAERVTGYSRAELRSRPAVAFFREEDHDRVTEAIKRTLEEGYAQVEVPLVSRDGHATPYEFRSRVLKNHQGRPIGITGVARDIQEQLALEGLLRRQRDALADHAARLTEANADLEAFAYLVSHDLKEPVRAIGAYLNAALEDCRSGAQEPPLEYLEQAANTTERLGLLVEGLLTLSRVNRLHPSELEPVAVEAVATSPECCVRYEQAAAERGAEVEVCPEGDAPVLATAPALAQILGNLILNGIRHNPSPRPHVRVAAAPAPGSPRMTRVTVEDDGPGFSDATVARFNARELLGGSSSHRGATGGFGLTIARRMVERLGGRMWLGRSEALGGASVTFTLPAAIEIMA
ncbi:MAG TPA: PAS domain S-box protein [Candidatus Thermoplasmatota archaeon]|nr:PAS domain S-box protein [Candidatus Thermoplasmatota archaeon]